MQSVATPFPVSVPLVWFVTHTSSSAGLSLTPCNLSSSPSQTTTTVSTIQMRNDPLSYTSTAVCPDDDDDDDDELNLLV